MDAEKTGTKPEAPNDANWPPAPNFAPPDQMTRRSLFGKFSFVPAPTPGNPEAIRITDAWVSKNMVSVEIPQLQNVGAKPVRNSVFFHRKGTEQLKCLFQAWEEAGLLNLVKTWGGSYAPRFIRGSQSILSNHAFGTAFDINVQWNPLGQIPALSDKEGSVRKLVPIAHEYGFFWGGHFPRRDGMHFELARLL